MNDDYHHLYASKKSISFTFCFSSGDVIFMQMNMNLSSTDLKNTSLIGFFRFEIAAACTM